MLMRHGEASPNFRDDINRSLTTHGFIETQNSGVWLKDTVHSIDKAIVSPYLRAQQTFDMVSSIVPVLHREDNSDVIPSGNASLVQDYVNVLLQESQISSLLIVSHMPLVSYLLDSFCGRLESRIFSTASIALLDYDPEKNSADIVAFHNP